jgi:DNA-binding transcriptional MerR regulator
VLASAAVRNKSPEAFRTISEVATDLDVPQHVLRFWEGRFAQIKPVKRAGGRRYYRPEDVDLLRGIRALLYREGFTIKGVQKILKERGHRHVIALGREETVAIIPTPQSRPKPVRIVSADVQPSLFMAPPSNVIALERLVEPAPINDTAESEDATGLDATDENPLGEDLADEDATSESVPAEGATAEDEPASAPEPVAAIEISAATLAEEERVQLEILLAELLQMKARLRAVQGPRCAD